MCAEQPLTLDAHYRLQTASDPQLSPDGSHVAYTLSQADREKDEMRSSIWVVPVAGGEPRQFTRGPKRDFGARWSPDGATLAFVSDRDGQPQIYIMPATGGEARRLTSLEEGVGIPVWSPDGRQIAFTSRVGEELEPKDSEAKERLQRQPVVLDELKHKFDTIGHFRGRRSQLFVVPVEGGEPSQRTRGPHDCTLPAWSPDGSQLAFVSARHEQRDYDAVTDIYVISAAGGEPRRLTPGRGPASSPSWSPDGRTIAYAANEYPQGQFGARNLGLWTIDASGGEPRRIDRAFDRSVASQPPPFPSLQLIWSQGGSEIVFGAMDRGAIHLFSVPSTGGAPRRVVGGERRTLLSSSANRDGSLIAVAASSYRDPSAILVVNADGTNERKLTHLNQEVYAGAAISHPEKLSFRAPDGAEFEGWLIKPADYQEGRRYPLLLDVHGGPHGAWGPGFSPIALVWQVLAAQGWAILYINPRGSSSYGEEFAMYLRNAWGEKDFPEFMAAVDRVIEMGIADPQRLAVTGYSYGGYMTNWIVGHTERFKAAVAGGCVSNMISMYGTSDIGAPFEDWEFGGPWWEQRERYERLSPISYVDRITTPLLLMHAEGDLRCPIGQSEEMFTALNRQRKPVQFVRFPGGNHLFVTMGPPSHRYEYGRRLIDWVRRWTAENTAPQRVTAAALAGD